jgi:hypothetical protein
MDSGTEKDRTTAVRIEQDVSKSAKGWRGEGWSQESSTSELYTHACARAHTQIYNNNKRISWR